MAYKPVKLGINELSSSLIGNLRNTTRCSGLARRGSSATDVTGDGTEYTIIWDTEILDQGSNYDNTTGILTFPVAGNYLIMATIQLIDLAALHNTSQCRLVTTARSYYFGELNPGIVRNGSNRYTIQTARYVTASAGNTCFVNATVGGSTKTVDIGGANEGFSHFSWHLLG